MPTIFISYSHDSNEHRERVLALSERLRKDGLETLLDQYVNGSPRQGWPRWMLDQLDAADFVLVVCTKTYYRRFRGHEKPGKGKGVDWEGALITQEIYDSRSRTLKFVPVFLSAAVEDWIPEPLRAGTHYVLTSGDGYQLLYDFLIGQAGVQPGPVGVLKTKTRRRGSALTFAAALPSQDASELIPPQEFADDRVKQAAIALSQARADKTLTMAMLVGTLDRLFDRDTFRREPSVGLCPTQEWDYRLHGAVQTLRLLEDYEPFVEAEARPSLERYRDLTIEVSRYCERMAAYLFDPLVGLAGLRRFVGTVKFIDKIHRKKKWFEGGVDPNTCRKIDPHLENALRQMKTLHDEFFGPAQSSGAMQVSRSASEPLPSASESRSSGRPRATGDVSDPAQTGMAYYNRGLRFLSAGNYDEAMDALNHAIQVNPAMPLAYYNRGLTYSYQDNSDLAIEDFNRALELGFDHALLFRNRGNAFSRKGDVKGALADYERAITLEPDNPLVYLNRGQVYENILRKDLAKADYQKILTLVCEPQLQEEARKRLQAMGIAVPVSQSSSQTSPALTLWRKKLGFLQAEEAKAADAEQKFSLQERIEEARAKIRELGG